MCTIDKDFYTCTNKIKLMTQTQTMLVPQFVSSVQVDTSNLTGVLMYI